MIAVKGDALSKAITLQSRPVYSKRRFSDPVKRAPDYEGEVIHDE